jgi:hypothetical protein
MFVMPDTDVGMCSRKWFKERIMNWDFYIRFMSNHLTVHKKTIMIRRADVFSCSWKCDCVFFIGRHYVMAWTKWPSSPLSEDGDSPSLQNAFWECVVIINGQSSLSAILITIIVTHFVIKFQNYVIYFFPCGTVTQRGLWPPHSWGF